jgi:HPt (histidine-containing phosphotransfer) domain-containing protein
MTEGDESYEAIDRSVLAGLRELQESGEPDIVAEVGGLFVKHAPEKLSAIAQAVEKGDAKGLQIAAHSLKSSSAYVGAMHLSAMSKELELMGRSGSLEGVKDKTEKMRTEYERVMAALEVEIKTADKR